MRTSYATNIVYRPSFHYTGIRELGLKLALCIKKGGKSINTIRDIGIGWISLIEQTRGASFTGGRAFYWLHTRRVRRGQMGVVRLFIVHKPPVICLYTSDHKCNGKRVENASTFHAIVRWGGDTRSREISSRVEWSFLPCWRGEGEGRGIVKYNGH